MFSFAFLKNSVWTYFVVSENFPVNKVFIMWTFKWMTNSLRYEYAILCGFFEKLRGNFKIENMKASRFSKILVWNHPSVSISKKIFEKIWHTPSKFSIILNHKFNLIYEIHAFTEMSVFERRDFVNISKCEFTNFVSMKVFMLCVKTYREEGMHH